MSYRLFKSNLSCRNYLPPQSFSQDKTLALREAGHCVSMKNSRQARENIQPIEGIEDSLIIVTQKALSIKGNDEGKQIIKPGGFFGKAVAKERPQTLTISTIVQGIRDDLYRGLVERITSIEFCHVPAGTFQMGKIGNFHQVTIGRDFYLGKYPVTQAQWEAIMENNPSYFKGTQRPVETVSWEDCQQFIEKLNHETGKNVYRLPTEAEWEYACRAGSTTAYSFGDDEERLGEYGWYNANSGGESHTAGQKLPNAWGLYDMHGNVWEWCQDWYAENYPAGPVTDPKGPPSSSDRVLRGGGWYDGARRCQSGFRSYFSADFRNSFFGFRLVRMA